VSSRNKYHEFIMNASALLPGAIVVGCTSYLFIAYSSYKVVSNLAATYEYAEKQRATCAQSYTMSETGDYAVSQKLNQAIADLQNLQFKCLISLILFAFLPIVLLVYHAIRVNVNIFQDMSNRQIAFNAVGGLVIISALVAIFYNLYYQFTQSTSKLSLFDFSYIGLCGVLLCVNGIIAGTLSPMVVFSLVGVQILLCVYALNFFRNIPEPLSSYDSPPNYANSYVLLIAICTIYFCLIYFTWANDVNNQNTYNIILTFALSIIVLTFMLSRELTRSVQDFTAARDNYKTYSDDLTKIMGDSSFDTTLQTALLKNMQTYDSNTDMNDFNDSWKHIVNANGYELISYDSSVCNPDADVTVTDSTPTADKYGMKVYRTMNICNVAQRAGQPPSQSYSFQCVGTYNAHNVFTQYIQAVFESQTSALSTYFGISDPVRHRDVRFNTGGTKYYIYRLFDPSASTQGYIIAIYDVSPTASAAQYTNDSIASVLSMQNLEFGAFTPTQQLPKNVVYIPWVTQLSIKKSSANIYNVTWNTMYVGDPLTMCICICAKDKNKSIQWYQIAPISGLTYTLNAAPQPQLTIYLSTSITEPPSQLHAFCAYIPSTVDQSSLILLRQAVAYSTANGKITNANLNSIHYCDANDKDGTFKQAYDFVSNSSACIKYQPFEVEVSIQK
jgi:hypothetical protein